MDGTEQGVFAVDLSCVNELNERILEGEGTLFLGQWDFLVKMLQAVSAHVMSGAVTHYQKFRSWNAASALSWQQDLRVHGGKGHCQLLANGVLAFDGK